MEKAKKPDFQVQAISLVKESVSYWERKAHQLRANLEVTESELKYLWGSLARLESLNLEELESEERTAAIDQVFQIIGVLQKRKDSHGESTWRSRSHVTRGL